MNYRLDKRYKKRNKMILAFLVLVIVFFMWKGGKFNRFSDYLVRVMTPIWKTEIAFTDVFLQEVFTSKKQLIQQNQILKNKLKEVEIELQKTSLLQEENESLKDIFLRSTSDSLVLGTILSKPTKTPYGTLIIDVGEGEGVSVEDLVFAEGDVVIGEIESVLENSSRVILYSSPGYISQVTIENTGRYFNAKGRGSGSFSTSFPRDLEIEVGQIFIYPSINNYVVGIVEKVIFDPRDSFKEVLFRSPVNIQELKWVQVRI